MKKPSHALSVVLFLLLFTLSCSKPAEPPDPTPAVTQTAPATIVTTVTPVASPTEESVTTPSPSQIITGKLTAHFIDVGQGDSCFVSLPNGQNMLIDAGDNGYGDDVVNYVESLGVSQIDYIICTHPHSDHIGGMDMVVNSFDIGDVYMPDIINTTKTFEDLLIAIENKSLSITVAESGTTLFDYDNLKAGFVAPVGETDDANNMSLVLRLVYGDTAFLFTGDAESESEGLMLNSGIDLESDVLKVAHHGSKTSSTAGFIQAVKPKYAIISVGKDNQYDHPHAETLATLNNHGALIYRTDEVGTIVATSDGTNTTINKNATVIQPNAPPEPNAEESQTTSDIEVFITNTGERYHLGGCSSLSKSKIPISLGEAKEQGYTPCGRCHPPE